MAIYHLHAQVISRGKGRSAIAAAAYRAAETIRDDRTGLVHSYERKEGVEHKEILAPEGVPDWVHTRAELWNQVEAAEHRKDAQVAREMVVALPVELNKDQQVELVRDFVREQFVKCGMVADLNVHRDNLENPHAHIMLTMRTIGPNGFGRKVREWNSTESLLTWREEWSVAVNRHLMQAQRDVRVDHRSFEAQGIELTPTKKIGISQEQHATENRDVIRERLARHDAIVWSNGEAIRLNPSLALDAITRQKATFTDGDLAYWLNPHTLDAKQFDRCMASVLASSEIVKLKDASGAERMTTKEMLQVEKDLLSNVALMRQRASHQVDDVYVHQALGAHEKLSGEQRAMVTHVVQESGDVAVVQGVAGAGKSYALSAARIAWEGQGYHVVGAALSGKAAEGLEVSSGIASRSIHSWEASWRNDRSRLTDRDVLVVDEAGMVGTRQMLRVMEEAKQAGAKVVLVGDIRQLQAIEAGAAMRLVADRVGQVSLGEVRRQEVEWQRKASEQLARGDVAPALKAYQAAGHVHGYGKVREAEAGMVARWDEARREAPHHSHLMLAFKREEVRSLNEAARGLRHLNKELGEDHLVLTEQGARHFAKHERIVFTRNDRLLGVMNGSLGTVEAIRGNIMTVRLDGDEKKQVVFDVREYKHLDHGYAVTAHKAQGITADQVHVLASRSYDQHVAYVALSRHRKQVDLHWATEEFGGGFEHLQKMFGRERMKDVALDYEQVEKDNRALLAKHEREPMSPNELANMRDRLVELERAAKESPVAAEALKHVRQEYEAAKNEMQARLETRAAELKSERGPGRGRGLGEE